jgi:hypothetical protein
VGLNDDIEDWPDERFWVELKLRLDRAAAAAIEVSEHAGHSYARARASAHCPEKPTKNTSGQFS